MKYTDLLKHFRTLQQKRMNDAFYHSSSPPSIPPSLLSRCITSYCSISAFLLFAPFAPLIKTKKNTAEGNEMLLLWSPAAQKERWRKVESVFTSIHTHRSGLAHLVSGREVTWCVMNQISIQWVKSHQSCSCRFSFTDSQHQSDCAGDSLKGNRLNEIRQKPLWNLSLKH